MFPRRSEGEESEYPFFEGDGSSSDEWKDYDMTGDDYEGPPVFDDDHHEKESTPVYDTDIEDVIEEEEGFFRKGGSNEEEKDEVVYDNHINQNDIGAPIDDKLGFTTIKVRGRVLTEKREFELLGHYNVSVTFIVSDLSPYSRESEDEESSRMSFSQAGEDDAGTLDHNVNLVEYLKF
nr:hypothetical protein [Tanacetum cinerariifolium]